LNCLGKRICIQGNICVGISEEVAVLFVVRIFWFGLLVQCDFCGNGVIRGGQLNCLGKCVCLHCSVCVGIICQQIAVLRRCVFIRLQGNVCVGISEQVAVLLVVGIFWFGLQVECYFCDSGNVGGCPLSLLSKRISIHRLSR